MSNGEDSEELLIRKTGNTYTAWFPESRSFVQLKDPAIGVIRRMEAGKTDQEIGRYLSSVLQADAEEIENFIVEVRTIFNRLKDPLNKPYTSPPFPDEDPLLSFKPHTVSLYLIHGITVRIEFGSTWLYQQLHPQLAHLATDLMNPVHLFQIFSRNDLLFLYVNGKLAGYFRKEESAFLKGEFLKRLTGQLHDITESGWMATFHASAISNGKSAVLFSASPGGGKSTIATLMQARGYVHFSDDFIPLDRFNRFVWKSPLAISVKEGALDLIARDYPFIREAEPFDYTPEKKVRYLAPHHGNNPPYALPVSSAIFIQYSPDTPLLVEHPEPEEAIRLMLEEAWINPESEIVAEFLEWFDTVKKYRITYSDNQLATEAIAKLFPNE